MPHHKFRSVKRQLIWAALHGAVVAFAFIVAPAAQAYDLEKCSWVANTAYEQAWYRDAGATLAQYKVLVHQSPIREEAKVGKIALAKYVYAHPDKSPDDLADDLMQDCRSYDQ